MPRYWMIANRDVTPQGLGRQVADLTYYTSDGPDLKQWSAWAARSPADFRAALAEAADAFPEVPETEHEKQKHVTLFVHGYNCEWFEAAERYQQIMQSLYSGRDSLGICILFNWPSNGATSEYLSDREDARKSGPALSQVFNTLYEHALLMQKKAADGTAVCKAKISVIAHSMGNWVLQNALRYTWERQNKPLLMSLINQCVMVAADVDNDLFSDGETVGRGPGEGIANLCYRIAALYTGRDSVLGVSAGLKHFGKRRLGRSGLDREAPEPDNVFDLDCTNFFPTTERNIHSAYFWTQRTLDAMREILKGYDRGLVAAKMSRSVRRR